MQKLWTEFYFPPPHWGQVKLSEKQNSSGWKNWRRVTSTSMFQFVEFVCVRALGTLVCAGAPPCDDYTTHAADETIHSLRHGTFISQAAKLIRCVTLTHTLSLTTHSHIHMEPQRRWLESCVCVCVSGAPPAEPPNKKMLPLQIWVRTGNFVPTAKAFFSYPMAGCVWEKYRLRKTRW